MNIVCDNISPNSPPDQFHSESDLCFGWGARHDSALRQCWPEAVGAQESHEESVNGMIAIVVV